MHDSVTKMYSSLMKESILHHCPADKLCCDESVTPTGLNLLLMMAVFSQTNVLHQFLRPVPSVNHF